MRDVLETSDRPKSYVATMEFRVLGSLEHGTSDAPTQLGGPKQRAVLAVLIKNVGRLVSADALADAVWGENPPGSVRSSVHTYISNLRVAIGGRIERAGPGYRLQVDADSLDAVVFERMVDDARATLGTNPDKAAETLRAALSLWRGRPYADLIDVPGLQEEIRRLEALRLLAVESRIDADLANGRHGVVIGELEALAAEFPLREGFRSRHMIALYRAGRQAEALRAYATTREYLADELGIEPTPELQELEDRILIHDAQLLSPRDVRTEEVAFLFTDIESSTVLWETQPDQMRNALTRHDEILNRIVSQLNGSVFKHTGDGILASFASVSDAAAAAAEAQNEFASVDWGDLELRVRMSVDVGDVDVRGGDYFGAPMNRGSRLMSVAHGGQVLLSSAAQSQIHSQPGIQIRSLGEHRLKGLGAPQQVFQLVVPGATNEFPELRLNADTLDTSRQFGDAIRGYEIRERIGVGRFGIVYRAYQPSVGREVAVKVIRPEFANHPAFVRNFETEARLVARLEHPHIVSLYDFWRDHEGAYLVMPYLSGRSLAGSPYGALPVDRVVQIIREVGSALAYAHRQGVVHRDVKPANILLDGEGNAYLADFGIAVRAVERATGVVSSSQMYRAPEDREGMAVDERSDVYSLAAVAAELLTGQRASTDDLTAIPTGVRGVIERAMEADQGKRHASIDDFLSELFASTGTSVEAVRSSTLLRNPYKSLHAFEESDARDFFGRDGEIATLLDLVSRQRFSTVVGPSGSGKSSLVKAGLLPALRTGRLAGSHEWLIVTTIPGAHPFDELATALADVATEGLGDLAAELRRDSHGLLRIGKRIMRDLEGDLVIVVDQFEELYSLVGEDSVRSLFTTSLIEATEDPHSRIRVVSTIRADFFDQPLLDDRLGPIVSGAHLALSVPNADALLQSIQGPATAAGVRFEAGLPHQIVSDVRDEPGGLPLMQFVLSDLVNQSSAGDVSFSAYEAAGGVTGALSRRATDVYLGLDAADRLVAEQIFLRLVTVSDDADDVRRRVRRSELEGLGLDAGAVDRVLSQFGDARLLTFDRDPITRGPTIEVAHEALLREWAVLRTWITGRRQSLLIQRRIEVDMAEWMDAGEPLDRLPTGGRLAQFEEWRADPLSLPTVDEARFLELALDQRRIHRVSRRRRRTAITGGFAIAALIASVLAFQAFRSEDLAEAREIVLEADRVVDDDPELSALLALTALESFRAAGANSQQAVTALRNAIARDRIIFREPGGRFAAVHPDGTLIATADGDDLAIWDRNTHEIVERYVREGAQAGGAAFSPDGILIAVSYPNTDNPVRVWNRSTGEFTDVGSEASNYVDDVAFNPAGDLVTFALDDLVEVWSTLSWSRVYDRSGSFGPSFSSSGRLAHLACSTEECTEIEVRIIEMGSGALLATLPTDLPDGLFTSWSPDEDRLAIGNQVETVVIDVLTGEVLAETDLDRTSRPEWLRDGNSFVVGGESDLRIIDAATGEILEVLGGQLGGTWSYHMIPDSSLLVSGGLFGGETVIFDLSAAAGSEVAGWTSPVEATWRVYYHSGGETITASDRDSLVTMAAETGDVLASWSGDGGGSWFPTANLPKDLISFSESGNNWSVYDVATGQAVFNGPLGWEIRGVSPRGDLALITNTSADSCETQVVSALDESPSVSLEAGCLGQANFSWDGTMVATSNLGPNATPYSIALFDVETGERMADLQNSEYEGLSMKFTPGDRDLVVGSFAGPVYVFDIDLLTSGADLESALRLTIPAHDDLVLDVVPSPDGSMLLTSAWSEPLKLWDLETGESLGQFGGALEGRAIHGGDFHPTLPRIVVTTPPGLVRIHTLDVDELIDIARSRITRHMTEEECQQYLRRACG